MRTTAAPQLVQQFQECCECAVSKPFEQGRQHAPSLEAAGMSSSVAHRNLCNT